MLFNFVGNVKNRCKQKYITGETHIQVNTSKCMKTRAIMIQKSPAEFAVGCLILKYILAQNGKILKNISILIPKVEKNAMNWYTNNIKENLQFQVTF